MSDALHGSTADIEALADEIRAKSKRRPSENFKQSSYPGLRHRTSAHKYRDCEYALQGFGRVRKLTVREVAEMQAHVQRCHDAKDAT